MQKSFIPIFGRGKVELPLETTKVVKRKHRAGRKLQKKSVYKNLCCEECNGRYTDESAVIPQVLFDEWIERRERADKVGKRAAPVVFGKCRACRAYLVDTRGYLKNKASEEREKKREQENEVCCVPIIQLTKTNGFFFLDEDLGFDLYYKAKEEEILLFLGL